MKKTLFVCFFALTSAVVFATMYVGDINGDGRVTVKDMAVLTSYLNTGATDSVYQKNTDLLDIDGNGTINVKDLDSLSQIILKDLKLARTEGADTLFITYANGTATYDLPSAWSNYITVTVSGGDVTVVNNNTSEEYITCLSGTSTAGSFTYTGSYKTTLVLNGVNLTSSKGAAINLQCGKRVSLELADGTTNTLSDGNGSQKAALYCKGHMEMSRGGSLTVQGTYKHAISSKEYILLKKTVGSITVTKSASDGIHCGQYFQMNGGVVNISGVTGDGIQAEMAEDDTEDDGKIIIKGGTLTIQTDSSDVAALKCDSTLHILDGTVNIITTGNSDKGLKTNGNCDIEGGTLTITQTGTYTVSGTSDSDGNVTYDASYVTAIKADSCINISDGTITITNTADGGKGLSADKDVNISGGTQTINANGAGGVLDTSGANISSGSSTENKSYRVYIALPSSTSSSGQGGPGGMGGNSTTLTWSSLKLCTSSGTLVATLTDQASVAGTDGTTTTFYYYDFGSATSGSYYFTATYTAKSSGGMGGPGGQSSSSTGTFTSSTLSLNLTGTNVFYSVTAKSSSSGGGGRPGSSSSTSYTFTTSDVTSTYSGGSIAAEEGDTYSAACIKADGDVTLSGGTLALTHYGTCSKGIKVDGTLTQAGTTVTDTAGGTYLIVGTDPSYCTAVKAGSFVGKNGSITVTATGQASRGISSDDTLVIDGGTYDMTLSGDGTTFTSNSDTEGCASIGMKSDGNMQLLSGDITINTSAKGGKGIKIGTSSATGSAGATLTVGKSGADNSLLSLDVNTTGTYLSTTSGGGNQPGGMGGGGMDEGFIGSTKAIKCMGAITINSGDIHLSTTSDGGEGLESKYTITFNGSEFESDTYDDAINAANRITFNDGCYVWAHASGNDGIDSNADGFVFNGGVICASGTSSPEEGFDCDQNSFVVNGGILIGTGGSTSSVTSASQGYATSSVSVTSGKYLSILDSSGNVLCSYKCPNTTSGSILVSHPSYSKGASIKITYNSTSISNPTDSHWDGVFTTGATLTGGTSKML